MAQRGIGAPSLVLPLWPVVVEDGGQLRLPLPAEFSAAERRPAPLLDPFPAPVGFGPLRSQRVEGVESDPLPW